MTVSAVIAQRRTPPPPPPPTRERLAADKLVSCACAMSLQDGGLFTADILAQALVIDPHHHQARRLLENLHRRQVPRWHFPMLGDQTRNAAFRRAIEAKVRPGDIVLDIGCGAGLTAMMAARAGAAHVYACENQPMIAAAAQEIVRANGLSDRITIIPKWSHELRIGVDLPAPADVVVSEIIDCVLLGEGALPTLEHAMRVLAKPDARAVPERGTLLAQPIESEELFSLWRPAPAEGFDLSAFGKFASIAELTPSDFAAQNWRALGPAEPLFAFDLRDPSLAPGRVERALPIAGPGALHAVSAVFELELAAGLRLSNRLGAAGHWGRTAFLLDAPRAVAPGDRTRIQAEHDLATLTISVA